MAFDVSDPNNNFLMWVMAHTLAGDDGEEKVYNTLFDQISAASEHFHEVVITMQVNGVEIPDGERFLRSLEEQFDYQVEQAAAALVKQKLGALLDTLTTNLRGVEATFLEMVAPHYREDY